MDLKRDYENLYQHWLIEFQQVDLTKLNQKLFDKYSKLLNSIDNHQENETDNIKFQVFESYKKNIKYLYEDLLRMRELKIINTALALKEINIGNEQKKEQVDLTLLRFIRKTPPLVGIDLINYGPFEEEDIAYIPSQNAVILVLEKFAEKVEIP